MVLFAFYILLQLHKATMNNYAFTLYTGLKQLGTLKCQFWLWYLKIKIYNEILSNSGILLFAQFMSTTSTGIIRYIHYTLIMRISTYSVPSWTISCYYTWKCKFYTLKCGLYRLLYTIYTLKCEIHRLKFKFHTLHLNCKFYTFREKIYRFIS